MELTDRRKFLKAVIGTLMAGTVWPWPAMVEAAAGHQIIDDSKMKNTAELSLWKKAAAKGIIYGAAGRYNDLVNDPEYATAFSRECRMLVPEIELKWSNFCNSPDVYDFSKTDWLLQFARRNGMLFRGHTLIWHHKLPAWFKNVVTRQNAEQTMVRHISKVVSRYAGKMHSWDVVNEAVLPSDWRPDGLRRTPWLELLGPDYIELAYRTAAYADPKAMLMYNEFELEFDGRKYDKKRESTLELLSRLKSAGAPVHALGIQGHLYGEPLNSKKFEEFLRSVQQLGLKIMITELDVIDKRLPADIKERDARAARMYEEYLSVALENKAVIGVITWGLSDKHSYLTDWHPRKDGFPVRPYPLDSQFSRKPAWYAMARAFDQAPVR